MNEIAFVQGLWDGALFVLFGQSLVRSVPRRCMCAQCQVPWGWDDSECKLQV